MTLRPGLPILMLLAGLAACHGESKVDRGALGPTGDIATSADHKARADAVEAIERRSVELRGHDDPQARALAEQARAMRDHNKVVPAD